MKNIKLSKGFAITVIAILVVWLLGPHILFSAGEKRMESEIASFNKLLEERQEKVTRSIESLGITDPNLLACITAAADERARIHPMNSGGIDDVRALKNLFCPRNKILSIQGIEQLTRLEFLDISRNYVEDISPLQANSALKSLRLDNNPIKDIYPLKNLTGLADVSLPELPKMTCDEIRKVIGDIRSNIKNTRCRGDTAPAASEKKPRSSTPVREEESYKLNSREEEELLDYEYELQRNFD